ncbi:MAG: hypothetical protein NT011_13855 [Kiritimatiellaeota bacterium]|nr:hypothetical protein [Kiritimatiellota bacterium]
MKYGVLILVVCIAALGVLFWRANGPGAKARTQPKLQGPIFNYDCTEFFYPGTVREGVDGGALVDHYVDLLADAGVKIMMCNPNARRTNYRSGVWESFWDGYDPKGPDDQPFMRPIPEKDRATWRRMVHSMWELDRQGVDWPGRIIARCRARGISPWISLRMNDVHCNDNLEHPFHGALFRQEKYFRGPGGGVSSYYARGLDYAHPEVRDAYRALIEEVLQRYDLDGLELDFMREPYLFAPDAEKDGAMILYAWLGQIRLLTDAAAARRGHPVRLGVRVPSRVEVAQGWGLDAVSWARAGLVDLIVPTPRFATLEYDMPLDEWREQLADTKATLAGGLERLHQPVPGGPRAGANAEQAAGAATAVLNAGADAVYLFNYFDYPANQSQTLRAMSSLETISALPRRHAITWRDIVGPGENYQAPLPATGKVLCFQLPTGPRPAREAEVTLIVQVKGAPAPAAAAVNETACELIQSTATTNGYTVLEYRVPLAALPGNRRDAIALTADEEITVVDVEVRIVPPAAKSAIRQAPEKKP